MNAWVSYWAARRETERALPVGEAHQVDVPQLGVDEDVVLAHVARPHHPGPQSLFVSLHRLFLSLTPVGAYTMPRLELAMNSTRWSIQGEGSISARTRSSAGPGAWPDR